ncbi:hypothetical protein Bra5_PD00868 (plasmid) [Rhizobium phaseoli Brasil 5]|nr:hypothetical protein Bra5_PD00868 [Rhizobium phaseoli Brasil 5]
MLVNAEGYEMTAQKIFGGVQRLFFVAPIAAAVMFHPQGFAQAAAELQWSQDPGSHCKFVTPSSLTSGPTFWIGACLEGKASGQGMLRRRDGERAGAAFFGRLKDGIPEIGVIDLGDGFKAGRFSSGDIGDEAAAEPQDRIDAFRIAAEAARLVGAKYAAEKNAGSARHYEELAKTLELQID